MTERDIQQRVLLALGSKPHVRLFRNNSGQAWAGDARRLQDGSVLIRNARPLHAGLHVGSADLIGWESVVVTPELVGRRIAAFLSVEVKGPHGRTTEQQETWLANVLRAGGLAGIVRSPEEAEALLIRPS